MSGKTRPDESRIDRRAARTRRLLHEALMQLIVRHDYESITIQDVLDEADVGRSTFYAHYAGKDDLLRRSFEHLRAELATAVRHGDAAEPLAFSAAMFAHAERFKDIYRALVGSRGNSIVLGEIRRVLLGFVEPELAGFKNDRVPREVAARFLVDSFQSVLTWWLERRPELGASDVDEMFRHLVVPTLRSLQKDEAIRARTDEQALQSLNRSSRKDDH